MEKYIVEVYENRVVWKNEKGEVHRLGDLPAVECANGDKFWYLNGKQHRVDGPAIEYDDGYKAWYLNGKYHRVDGPAIELVDGSKDWYLNDNLHRVDGPAIEYADGDKAWYLNGEELSEAEFNERTKPDPCEGKLIEIEGKKYKLIPA